MSPQSGGPSYNFEFSPGNEDIQSRGEGGTFDSPLFLNLSRIQNPQTSEYPGFPEVQQVYSRSEDNRSPETRSGSGILSDESEISSERYIFEALPTPEDRESRDFLDGGNSHSSNYNRDPEVDPDNDRSESFEDHSGQRDLGDRFFTPRQLEPRFFEDSIPYTSDGRSSGERRRHDHLEVSEGRQSLEGRRSHDDLVASEGRQSSERRRSHDDLVVSEGRQSSEGRRSHDDLEVSEGRQSLEGRRSHDDLVVSEGRQSSDGRRSHDHPEVSEDRQSSEGLRSHDDLVVSEGRQISERRRSHDDLVVSEGRQSSEGRRSHDDLELSKGRHNSGESSRYYDIQVTQDAHSSEVHLSGDYQECLGSRGGDEVSDSRQNLEERFNLEDRLPQINPDPGNPETSEQLEGFDLHHSPENFPIWEPQSETGAGRRSDQRSRSQDDSHVFHRLPDNQEFRRSFEIPRRWEQRYSLDNRPPLEGRRRSHELRRTHELPGGSFYHQNYELRRSHEDTRTSDTYQSFTAPRVPEDPQDQGVPENWEDLFSLEPIRSQEDISNLDADQNDDLLHSNDAQLADDSENSEPFRTVENSPDLEAFEGLDERLMSEDQVNFGSPNSGNQQETRGTPENTPDRQNHDNFRSLADHRLHTSQPGMAYQVTSVKDQGSSAGSEARSSMQSSYDGSYSLAGMLSHVGSEEHLDSCDRSQNDFIRQQNDNIPSQFTFPDISGSQRRDEDQTENQQTQTLDEDQDDEDYFYLNFDDEI